MRRMGKRVVSGQWSAASVLFLLAALVSIASLATAQNARIGKAATEAQIHAIDLTIFSDGTGLPVGKGTAAKGRDIFKDKCAVCHNDKGEGRENQYPALVGGIGTIATSKPVRTVGSYWPYATTVFDYVRRAMPYDHPGSLQTDEIYSVVAFILNLNGIIGENDKMNEKTLPKVKMPNAENFVPDTRPDVKAKR
jgi:S-disulfanyl-L-cysteine oxidoreductase SoxD